MSFEDSKTKTPKALETPTSFVVPDSSTSRINNKARFVTQEKEEENRHDMEFVGIFNGNGSEVSKERAFKEIVDCHYQRIFRFVSTILNDQRDAEEITSQVFVNAHRSLSKFRGDSSLSVWLYTIAKNLAHNRFVHGKRRGRDKVVSLDAPISFDGNVTLADVIPSGISSPRENLSAAELSELIKKQINRLDPKQREILRLRNEENMSYEEIAMTLGIGVGTVKSKISRARDDLNALISD